jgi:hypothetical protein
MGFADDIARFAKKAKRRKVEVVTVTFFKLNELVIYANPVITGRSRGGWIASIGSIPSGTGGLDKNGAATISNANAVAVKAVGSIYYLVNNVKYIGTLEYGGYPNPPKVGSWDKITQSYKILSVGGYSKQAPAGMVRISIAQIKNFIADEVRRGN